MTTTEPHLNRALSNFRKAITARYPDRDHTSDGWIADDRHRAAGVSDHIEDVDGTVDALDVDADLHGPGDHAGDAAAMWQLASAFSAHPAAGYVIFQDMIASRAHGWRLRPYAYAGPKRNRHVKHAHFNTRPAFEDAPMPFDLGARGPLVAPTGKPKADPPKVGEDHPGGRVLRVAEPAMRGEDVVFVQQWIGLVRCGHADGAYGPQTAQGVAWYQRMRGLSADGVVGPVTWAAMGVG